MFDISSQAVVDTAAIHLKGLDGEFLYDSEGRPVSIVIFGPGSAPFAAIEAKQTARQIKRMNEIDGKIPVVSPDQRIAEMAEDLAAITVEFRNFIYPAGGEKQGVELYRAFYSDKKFGHITVQIAKSLADWGNWRPGSAGN